MSFVAGRALRTGRFAPLTAGPVSRVRLSAAMRWCSQGRISHEKAAQIASVSREERGDMHCD